MSLDFVKKPFEHLVIDSLLSDEDFEYLCELLSDIELECKDTDLFQFDQSQDLSHNKDFTFLQDAIKEKVGMHKLDMFAAFYYDTDYLLPHDDQLEGRKIAYTFYVAAPDTGGELSLIENTKPYKKHKLAVVPNRLVLFKVSEDSWHEVEEVRGELPRISLSGWFYD